jgi:hypothetical protein
VDEFLASLVGYNISTFRFGAGASPRGTPPPAPRNPYGAALGHLAGQLPAGLRRFHEEGGRAAGTLEVTRGSSLTSRLLAALAQLPSPAAACPVEVTSERVYPARDANDAGVFRWSRLFQGRPLTSLVSFERGLQMERFGPWSFGFQVLPVAAEDGRRGLRHVTKVVALFSQCCIPHCADFLSLSRVLAARLVPGYATSALDKPHSGRNSDGASTRWRRLGCECGGADAAGRACGALRGKAACAVIAVLW